jgi:hypothetical protein
MNEKPAMSGLAKQRWLRVAEVVLAVATVALLIATWLPALISQAGPMDQAR